MCDGYVQNEGCVIDPIWRVSVSCGCTEPLGGLRDGGRTVYSGLLQESLKLEVEFEHRISRGYVEGPGRV